MSVHVGDLMTEVSAVSEEPSREQGGLKRWEELDRVRENYARIVRDRIRTCAEGFDG